MTKVGGVTSLGPCVLGLRLARRWNGPVLHGLYDKMTSVISQGNTRRGAAAYLPVEHPDILEFWIRSEVMRFRKWISPYFWMESCYSDKGQIFKSVSSLDILIYFSQILSIKTHQRSIEIRKLGFGHRTFVLKFVCPVLSSRVLFAFFPPSIFFIGMQLRRRTQLKRSRISWTPLQKSSSWNQTEFVSWRLQIFLRKSRGR